MKASLTTMTSFDVVGATRTSTGTHDPAPNAASAAKSADDVAEGVGDDEVSEGQVAAASRHRFQTISLCDLVPEPTFVPNKRMNLPGAKSACAPNKCMAS